MNVRNRIRFRLRTVPFVPPFTVASPNKRPQQLLTCLLKNLITFIYCILLFMCLHLVCFLNLFLVSDFVVFRKYFDSSWINLRLKCFEWNLELGIFEWWLSANLLLLYEYFVKVVYLFMYIYIYRDYLFTLY